eukprot:gene7871-9979_t
MVNAFRSLTQEKYRMFAALYTDNAIRDGMQHATCSMLHAVTRVCEECRTTTTTHLQISANIYPSPFGASQANGCLAA